MAELPGGSHSKLLFYDEALLVLGSEKVSKYYRHVMYVLDLDLNVTGRYILSADVEADSYFTIGKASIENSILYVAGINKRPGNFQWTMYSIALKPQLLTVTVTTTITETKTETVRETMTTTITKTEPKTETTTQTTTRTVTALETKIMTTTQKETVKTTETLEVTKEITKTETTTREIIPTTPLVAASIALIVLAISLVILLRGRK
ncbi:MAG: hypothetical protein P3X22_007095 [Thermoprotei archaeon]|nr:hypothetical protein [Thermoprotei archaeon]